MKKIFVFIFCFSLLFFLIGCSGNSIIGEWTTSEEFIQSVGVDPADFPSANFKLTADGKVEYINPSPNSDQEMTYSIQGDQVTFFDHTGAEIDTYTLDGKNLVSGDTIMYTKK